jgi:hypothetical protein
VIPVIDRESFLHVYAHEMNVKIVHRYDHAKEEYVGALGNFDHLNPTYVTKDGKHYDKEGFIAFVV